MNQIIRKELVQEYLTPLVKKNLLSGNILISIANDILLNQSYGYANQEKLIFNTEHTRFRIFSTTKMFTAVAILQLYEQQKLQLEVPISKYIPKIRWKETITIKQLLNHSSGIKNYDYSLPKTAGSSLDEMIQIVLKFPLTFNPGEKQEYSNSGYVLLSKIIEITSELSYMQYLEQNIFQPLNMVDTGLYFNLFESHLYAKGYSRNDIGEWVIKTRPCPQGYGDGDLFSTVGDLQKFGQALLNHTLITANTWKIQTTVEQGNMGYGCFISDLNGNKCVYHQGGSLGFMGNLKLFPSLNIVIVTLFNSDNLVLYRLEEKITKYAITGKFDPLFLTLDQNPEIKQKIEAFTGSYFVDNELTIHIVLKDQQVWVRENHDEQLKAEILDEKTFYIPKLNYRFHFEMDSEGHQVIRGFLGLFMVIGDKLV